VFAFVQAKRQTRRVDILGRVAARLPSRTKGQVRADVPESDGSRNCEAQGGNHCHPEVFNGAPAKTNLANCEVLPRTVQREKVFEISVPQTPSAGGRPSLPTLLSATGVAASYKFQMERQDAVDLVECLDVCPMDAVTCAQVCDRAAAVGARQRGLPFYVPFRQAPLQDWATLFPGSPSGSNWQAYDAPNASFAPWVRATVPWSSEWNLAAPPLSATAVQTSSAQCHRMCDAQSEEMQLSVAQGLGPLPGVYTGWWQAPWSQLYAPPLLAPEAVELSQRLAFGEYLEDAMGPTSSLDARLPPWQLSPPVGLDSFRANHIPIHGQPVAFRQALPTPLPADLRG